MIIVMNAGAAQVDIEKVIDKVTERGLKVLKSKPKAIDTEYLGQFPEFRE